MTFKVFIAIGFSLIFLIHIIDTVELCTNKGIPTIIDPYSELRVMNPLYFLKKENKTITNHNNIYIFEEYPRYKLTRSTINLPRNIKKVHDKNFNQFHHYM